MTDVEFMKTILPHHYKVTDHEYGLQCFSPIGIKMGKDDEDEEHWDLIMSSIRKHFGSKFLEVYHHTCTFHVNFAVYLDRGQYK